MTAPVVFVLSDEHDYAPGSVLAVVATTCEDAMLVADALLAEGNDYARYAESAGTWRLADDGGAGLPLTGTHTATVSFAVEPTPLLLAAPEAKP